MNFTPKILIKPLVLGCIFAVILMFFELRYVYSDADFSLIKPTVIFLLVSQAIFFTLVFLVVTLAVKYVRNGFLKRNRLEGMGLALLFIHLVSFLIALTYIPYLTYLNLIISVILIFVAVISYRRTKNELAIAFILWGIVIFIFSLMFTGVGYWS